MSRLVSALRTEGLFGARAEPHGNRARAALWSTYFHRYHNHWGSDSAQSGPVDEIPPRYRPLTPNEAMRTLNDEAMAGDVPRSVLRGAASQVLWSAYELDGEGEKQLAQLASRAEATSADEAYARIRERGDPFQRSRRDSRSQAPVEEHSLTLGPQAEEREDCRINYIEVRSTGLLTVLSYEILLARPLEQVAPLVDPRSWPQMAPQFLEARIIQPSHDPGPPGQAAWHGRYFEHVAINWNLMTLNSFEVTLKAEVIVEPFEVRTDYALIREKRWQLANDYGYLRAQRCAGKPGWTVISAEKCVTYRSPWLNFMSPAVLSMVAGQWAESIRDAVDRSAPQPSRGT